MLPFFKKKKKEEEFCPPVMGRLEMTYGSLKAKYGAALTGRIYDVDIAEYVPEFLNTKLPTRIHVEIRRVLDDYLNEGDEFYFQADETVYGLFFSKATKTVGDLKVDVIRNELSRMIAVVKKKPQAQKKEEDHRKGPEVVCAVTPEGGAGDHRGVLSDNPDEFEMRAWASRAFANMAKKSGYEDLLADMNQLSEIVKIDYSPLWYMTNRLVSGYMLNVPDAVTLTGDKKEDENKRKIRANEDLAVLAAAYRNIKEMFKRREYVLLLVPVHIKTLSDHDAGELYNIYFRGMLPEIKKFIVLKVRGLEQKNIKQKDWEALKAIAYHCRSIIVDTGGHYLAPEDVPYLNFHSYGFDVRSYNKPEDELFMILDQFSAFYQQYNKDTFILGLESQSLLAACLGAGYTYLSGNAVAPALVRPNPAKYLDIEDVYKSVLPSGEVEAG